jgi:hypothetical protein
VSSCRRVCDTTYCVGFYGSFHPHIHASIKNHECNPKEAGSSSKTVILFLTGVSWAFADADYYPIDRHGDTVPRPATRIGPTGTSILEYNNRLFTLV